MRSILSSVLCGLALCLPLTQSGIAQEAADSRRSAAPPAARNTHVPPPETPARNPRAERAAVVGGFIDRAVSFQDVIIKVGTLAEMADALWGFDEARARELFFRAYEDLRTLDAGAQAGRQAGLKRQLMTVLVARVAKRDSLMARYMINSVDDSDRNLPLIAARSLVQTDPAKAVEFAEQSLNNASLRRVILFLYDLRLKDEAAANAFFLRVLNFLVAQPVVDAETLMRLGAYVFTSPSLGPSDGAFETTEIGGQSVVNLTADRPSVPREIVRSYLEAAVTILTRPVSDPQQRQIYYITARQLLPRVEAIAPARLRELTKGMEHLATGVPAQLAQDSTYEPLRAESYQLNPDVSLKTLEATGDETAYNAKCLLMTHAFYEAGRLAEARLIADKHKDAGVRARLAEVIDYKAAAAALQRGDAPAAAKAAANLAHGVPRVVLLLAIARRAAEKNDKVAAAEALGQALQDARKLDDPRRAPLTLAAATLLTRVDAGSAAPALHEAVQAYNKREKREPAAADWSIRIESRPAAAGFSLSVEGLPLSFSQAVRPLLAGSFDETVSSLLALKEEADLGPALAALTDAALKTAETKRAK